MLGLLLPQTAKLQDFFAVLSLRELEFYLTKRLFIYDLLIFFRNERGAFIWSCYSLLIISKLYTFIISELQK